MDWVNALDLLIGVLTFGAAARIHTLVQTHQHMTLNMVVPFAAGQDVDADEPEEGKP